MSRQHGIPDRHSNDWLEKLDGRTRIAQIVNDRLRSLVIDLGGIDNLSYQQRSLCKRAIWLEAALSRGETVDQGRLTQAVNSLMGLLKTLGLKRVARDVPSLQEYLAHGDQRKAG